jgi:hypothetical protein
VPGVQPSVQAVAKDLRLLYARYKVSRFRPPGMGAFHDFVLATPYLARPARKAGHHAFGHAARARLDAEGGITPSATMRSLA